MKKILNVLLVCMLMFISGCGEKRPDDVPEAVYNDGVKAIEVFDKYWDAQISAEDAKERLENISDRRPYQIEQEYPDATGMEEVNILKVYQYIDSMAYSIMFTTEEGALEKRNELAEVLNKKPIR